MANSGAREANTELRHGELVAAIERIDRLRASLVEANGDMAMTLERLAVVGAERTEAVKRAEKSEADLAASLAREGEQGEALIAVKCELVRVRGVLREVLSIPTHPRTNPGATIIDLVFDVDLRARAEAEVAK